LNDGDFVECGKTIWTSPIFGTGKKVDKDGCKSEGKNVFRCREKRSKTVIFRYFYLIGMFCSTTIPIGAFVIMLHPLLKTIFDGGRPVQVLHQHLTLLDVGFEFQ